MAATICVVCKRPLGGQTSGGSPGGDAPRLSVRYENRTYSFDSERCKRIFYENPDRWLDAGGAVLEQPR